MKLKSTLLVLVGTLFLISACGGTKQDPLDGQSDDVKNGKAPGIAEAPKKKPADSNVLKIDGPDSLVVQEGEEREITFTARSLFVEDTEYALEFTSAGAAEYKNATVTSKPGNSAKGELASITIKWKVPKGLAAGQVTDTALVVSAYTTNLKAIYSVEKNVTVFISSNSKNVPNITKVEVPVDPIKENTNKSIIKVYVTDNDSSDVVGRRPSLIIMPDTSGANGAAYLVPAKNPVKDPALANSWIFDVVVDLTNAEMTAYSANAKFLVAATSYLGRLSAFKSASYSVWTSVSQPVSSWQEIVYFKRQQANSYTFIVTDPRGEGLIDAKFTTNCSALEGKPVCDCKSIAGVSGKSKGAAQCSITWTPPAGGGIFFAATPYTISVSVTNQSPITNDKDNKVQIFNGVIQLVN